MSQVYSANEICGLALGNIGQWPTSESAPPPELLPRAMQWLDLNMAQFLGSTRVFAFVSDTLDVEITNGTSSYDLDTALGADLPIDRCQFPVNAWLEDGNGNRTPVTIVTRDKFENVSRTDESGPPCWIHIDRSPATPTLRIFPTPATTDTNTYTIKLIVQTFAPNVAPQSVNNVTPVASILHGFPQAWQRWLIFQLSHDLGSGAITKLGEQSLNRFAGIANDAKTALEAFENREHATEAPVCEAWGIEV